MTGKEVGKTLLSMFQSTIVHSIVVNEYMSTTILLRHVPKSLAVSMVHVKDLPVLVRGCRLPAVLDETGRYCRAGLAVVLRHIIDRTCEADPRRKDAASLLGFKKTCLKACAEVRGNTQLL